MLLCIKNKPLGWRKPLKTYIILCFIGEVNSHKFIKCGRKTSLMTQDKIVPGFYFYKLWCEDDIL